MSTTIQKTADHTVTAFTAVSTTVGGAELFPTYLVTSGGTAIGYGAGTAATALRATLASDDPAVALLTTMDTDTGAIATSAASIDGKITECNTGAVVVSSSALPSGAATSAKQDTQTTHLATLAGAVDGTEVQVDIVSGSVTIASGSVTADTELPAAAALADNTANPTVPGVGAFGHVYDGSTWDRMPGTSADGVLVNLGSNNDVTVTGSVTANAGTNLNTSLLALESGGNLAGAATSLAVIDDWDESDRAKVNIVAGQAGVTAGAGAVAANTPRVTLASDDPGVALLTTIDGDTGTIATHAATLAGAVSGTEMQVDVLTMPSVTIVDGGSSITVDAPVGTPVFVRLSDGASAITTLPVSLASVPSHAVTNAGTFAVQVDGTALTRLTDIETNTDSGAVVGNGTAATAQRVTLANDSTGTVTVTQGTATNLKSQAEAYQGGSAVGAANPLQVTLANGSVPSHAVTNAGTFAVQVDGAALTALQLIDDAVYSDDAAFTPGTSKVIGIGAQADETSTDSVDEGDIGAPRMTLDRKLIVVPQPHAAGGLSIFRSIDLDESEEEVSASPCSVYSCWVTNTATSTRWIKFYNATAANVTVGTTTPVITIGIPGNSSDDIAAHLAAGGHGIKFDTALSIAATTGVADNDTGAPGANEVIINVFYK